MDTEPSSRDALRRRVGALVVVVGLFGVALLLIRSFVISFVTGPHISTAAALKTVF
jgi:hypothetical protein